VASALATRAVMLNQIAEVALTSGDATALQLDPRASEMCELATNNCRARYGARHARSCDAGAAAAACRIHHAAGIPRVRRRGMNRILSLSLLSASLGACMLGGNDQSQSDWRDAIAASPSADAGCFHAAYPSMEWDQISCSTAPGYNVSAPAPTSIAGVPFTVGNGADYALQSSTPITHAVGTFPHVSGLVSENDGGSNAYTLQLNSNFMSGTAACASGVGGGSDCLSWAQFVYFAEEGEGFVFMQNWLIGYGSACPTTEVAGQPWNSFDGQDCFINSAAVSATAIPLSADSDLSEMKIEAAANATGNDTMVFAAGSDAFSTNEPDNITNLASAWNAAEFNILGDGGGTEAIFNKSTAIEVRVGVRNGSTTAPTCAANAGTTGETNNRVLGACSAFAGDEPAIEFKETGSGS
jgi:hypothetical protein